MDPDAYAQHAAVEDTHWWFRGRRAIASSVIAGLDLPRPARVVELGSGTGGNLPMLEALGDAVAIEPDESARELSRRRHPRTRHVATIDALEGPAFDAAFAFDVLEHIDDPPSALRQLHAWLAPGAPLVVTVPAHPWMFGGHDAYLHHLRRYTRRELAQHLEDGRFVVEQLTPINAALFPAAVAARGLELGRGLVGPRRPPAARGMTEPPRLLNELLARVFGAERRVLRVLPTGLSLLAVARATTLGPAGAEVRA